MLGWDTGEKSCYETAPRRIAADFYNRIADQRHHLGLAECVGLREDRFELVADRLTAHPYPLRRPLGRNANFTIKAASRALVSGC